MAGADDQLSGSGVSYNFQYIGNIEVVTSMRSLDFDVRTNLTKECIYQVCERAKLLHGRKHAVDVRAAQLLGANPRIQLVGLNVDFVISTRALTVAHADRTQIERCGTLLLMHPLPNVSFASAGDAEMPDYVCYVAKDDNNGRRCYVYECGKQMAAQVLKTVGDAFNMRHGSLVASSQPPSASVPLLSNHPPPRSPALINFEIPVDPTPTRPAPEYVNDSAISAHHDTISFSPLSPSPPSNLDLLSRELWYHGKLSREDARRLLRLDGDFLVRQSTKDPDQFVLTGMQNGVDKHLLLIDDKDRKVRTKDREFQNVSHLIQYHRDHKVPITSEESALLLLTPINRC